MEFNALIAIRDIEVYRQAERYCLLPVPKSASIIADIEL